MQYCMLMDSSCQSCDWEAIALAVYIDQSPHPVDQINNMPSLWLGLKALDTIGSNSKKHNIFLGNEPWRAVDSITHCEDGSSEVHIQFKR